MFKKRYVFMDEAGAAGAAGGGASGGDGSAGAAAGASGAAGAGANQAGSGEGGNGAVAGQTGAGSAGAGSALAAGAAAAGTGAANGSPDFIPEKYRVTKDDGTLDIEASTRKLADGYGELSKRFGAGDAAPKTAAEYAVAVPDALKEAVGDLNTDPVFTKFRDDMHALGISQKQFDGVMSRYFELAPALAAGGMQASVEAATADLQATWKDPEEFKKQVGMSYRAASTIAQAAGMTYEDIDKAGLGNNPTFIKLMAAIGPELGEDKPVNGDASTFTSEETIKGLMMSEANTNPKHANHAATRAKIDAYYARKYGTAPVV